MFEFVNLENNISYRICRNDYDLSSYNISHAMLQWFISYPIKVKTKYRLHAAAMLLFCILQKFNIFSNIHYHTQFHYGLHVVITDCRNKKVRDFGVLQ
jgi:hypothetical protein